MTHFNADLWQRAQACLVGGVNSPVRAFRAVGGEPLFFERGEGAYLVSQGRRYIDYVCSWGAIMLGHADPVTLDALQNALHAGWGFGASTALEVRFAEKLLALVPTMEQVRMVSSGTEATMTAIRLARGVTGREAIIKFEGCYHGHSDPLLVKAGSGALTFGTPSSSGVPSDCVKHTLVATFNELAPVEAWFKQQGDTIAAIIVEPVAGNANLIPPVEGFLAGLRGLCDKYGALLIFDEVMTGFRVDPTSAQGLYQVKPDITTWGKVIGGGLPVAALGGTRAIMAHLSPLGSVYQAGTLSGNPLAMVAGLIALETVSQAGFYEALFDRTKQLVDGLQGIGRTLGIPLSVKQVGAMWGVVFAEQVTHYHDVITSDTARFNQFFHGMLAKGILLPPSAFETCFITAAHSQQAIDVTLDAAFEVLSSLKNR